MKTLSAIVLFLMFASLGFCNPLTGIGTVPAGGEDDLILAPVGSIEFNPSTSNNYGLALTESVAFAKVLPGQDANHVVISPYGFAGVFMAANIGQWAATNGGAAWSIDYGLMIGLPKLDESIPEVAFAASWNTIERGDAKLMINVAFPADILSSVLVHKL